MFKFQETAQVFQSDEDHQHFLREGYVIKQLLDPAEVVHLQMIYERLHPDGVQGFYTTTFHPDPEHRQQVNDSILETALPRIEAIFKDFKIYFASFIVKEPGPKSKLIMHQDMTLVDESKYNGINIWCPLINLTETNGAIEVLPRSHRLYPTYRGSSLPDIYDGLVEEVANYLKPLHLKAGEAVIFDQSIIHNSPPNLSHNPRPVINIFVTHKDAKIRIAYHNKEEAPEKVELFEQEDDFLMNFQQFGNDIFSRPKIGKSLGFTEYDFPKLTVERLVEEYGALTLPGQKGKSGKKKGFFARLFGSKN